MRWHLLSAICGLLGRPLYACRAASAGVVIVVVNLGHVKRGYFLAVVI
jgi:hypothetical protein